MLINESMPHASVLAPAKGAFLYHSIDPKVPMCYLLKEEKPDEGTGKQRYENFRNDCLRADKNPHFARKTADFV